MVRRPEQGDTELIRKKLISILENFRKDLESNELRPKVLALVPAAQKLQDLGCSLLPIVPDTKSARDRILFYLKKYTKTILHGDEIQIVSGISEWARRVRELRVEHGWSIINGVTAKEMQEEGEFTLGNISVEDMGPDNYILTDDHQDREGAYRWKLANVIRNENTGVQSKLLKFFKENIGKAVSGEELKYIAKDKKEWARRIRELRTEEGWPIATCNTGRPDLPIGSYILEKDRQSPPHDRKIPDQIRGKVLRRDEYTCAKCKWNHKMWNPSDPRHLELHHIKNHVHGGENSERNLITVCTICHDQIHKK